MARRRGSATALNASEVVAARAMPQQYIPIWAYVKHYFLSPGVAPSGTSQRPKAPTGCEFHWTLFLIGFLPDAYTGAGHLVPRLLLLRVVSSFPRLLAREGEFAGRTALLQRGHFAIFHNELIDDIGKLRGPEFEPLEWNQLDGRSPREGKRETGSRLIKDFKFHLGRSHVSTRKFFEQRRVQRFGLACEHNFRLIQGHHGAINITLRIRPEIDGEFAVLLVVGRVKAIVVKVAQRKIERVKTELQRVAL